MNIVRDKSIATLIVSAWAAILLLCAPSLAFAQQDATLTTATPTNLSKAKIAAIDSQVYTGSTIEPEVVVTRSGETLQRNVDYTVTYADNVAVGTATVTVTAIEGSGYEGSKSRTFSIVQNKLIVEKRGNDITFSEEGTGYINVKKALSSFTGGSYTLNGGKKDDPQVVTFKEGTYLVPRMALGSYVTINATGATFKSSSTGGFYVAGQTSKGKGGYSHVRNIKINGGKYLITKSNSQGSIMKFSHGKNIKLSNFSINNCYGTHFIEFIGISNSTISKVKLTGKYVGTPDNEAIQLDNPYNATVAPNCTPYDATPTKNVTIKNCTIKVPSMPYGIGTQTVHKKLASKIKIIGCNITAKTNAIELVFSKNCLIKNNVFHKTDIKRNDSMVNLKEVGNKFYKK